ncbi:allophanate hydrolase subunit 1 [Plautia stali symbiont]|nr:allophanate hydrolase subunit 1 [Plautia stali symbiont]
MVYGGAGGPDLAEVARAADLTSQQVVELHSSANYVVYFIGFQPGFPYLGGLDERLHTPRRAEPRLVVPSGSVGIGGSQTGIYPLAAPGGWQLIGHTPLSLFDPQQQPPTLLRPGDSVRFVPQREGVC